MCSLHQSRSAQVHPWLYSRSVWWPAALWFNFWFQRNLFSIFAPLLIRDLGLTYTGIGIVESGVLGTTAIGYIAAGHFVRESIISNAFKIALLLEVAASALSGLSGGLFQLVVFQSIQGFVEGVLFVGVVVLISGFNATDLSRAYGAFESCGNLGWFLALSSGGFVGVLLGWRWSYLLLSLPILGLLPFKMKVTPIGDGRPELAGELGFLRKLDFWLVALPLTLFLMNWYAVWTFAPSFLVTRGFSIEEAGLASALAVAFSVPAPFVIGLLISRAKPIRLAVSLLTLTTVMQILLPLSRGKLSITSLLVAIGILQASTSPILFVLLSELVSTLKLPTVSGWSVAIGYWAALLGPVVFGNIADTASFSASFSLFAILNVICIVAMLSNRKRNSGLFLPH
jgi:MFS family permease